jgi:hypothetical protein
MRYRLSLAPFDPSDLGWGPAKSVRDLGLGRAAGATCDRERLPELDGLSTRSPGRLIQLTDPVWHVSSIRMGRYRRITGWLPAAQRCQLGTKPGTPSSMANLRRQAVPSQPEAYGRRSSVAAGLG